MYDTNTIDADQRAQVQELRLGSTLKPAERDLVEMILLSDARWSPPAISTHLGYCSATTRRVLRGFQIDGIEGLDAPAQDLRRTQIIDIEYGVRFRIRCLAVAPRVHLSSLSLCPTTTSISALARCVSTFRLRELATFAHSEHYIKSTTRRKFSVLKQPPQLSKKAVTGELTPAFLDEYGFSPSPPVNHS